MDFEHNFPLPAELLVTADQALPKSMVSVIIPTYRHSNLVLSTLQSVFNQTFSDYEVIVINDGSPDDTRQVLQPLIDDGKIRYFEQENQGQSATRNNGIREANGEFIALLDDDDLWPPDKLAWQVSLLEAEPEAVLAYGFSKTLGEEHEEGWPPPDAPQGCVLNEFLRANWIVSPGQTLIRAEALRQIGGFDHKIWGADDWDLYIRLSSIGRFAFSHRCALFYRRHAENASHDSWRMYDNLRRVQRKHLGYFPRPRTWRVWRDSRRWFAPLFIPACVQQALDLTAQGEYGRARMLWRQIFATAPTYLNSPGVIVAIVKCLLHKKHV